MGSSDDVRLADVFRLTEDFPAGLRLRIALDLATQFEGKGRGPLEQRGPGGTLCLANVVVDAAGVARVEGDGAGLLELVWEVLAGQPYDDAGVTALNDVVPGISRDVEVQLALGEAADDVDDFAEALEDAARGDIDTHADVRRAVQAIVRASSVPPSASRRGGPSPERRASAPAVVPSRAEARPRSQPPPPNLVDLSARPSQAPAVEDESTARHDVYALAAAMAAESAAAHAPSDPPTELAALAADELAPDSDNPTVVADRTELIERVHRAAAKHRAARPRGVDEAAPADADSTDALGPGERTDRHAATQAIHDAATTDEFPESMRDTLVPEGGLGAELLRGAGANDPAVADLAARLSAQPSDPSRDRARGGARRDAPKSARPPTLAEPAPSPRDDAALEAATAARAGASGAGKKGAGKAPGSPWAEREGPPVRLASPGTVEGKAAPPEAAAAGRPPRARGVAPKPDAGGPDADSAKERAPTSASEAAPGSASAPSPDDAKGRSTTLLWSCVLAAVGAVAIAGTYFLVASGRSTAKSVATSGPAMVDASASAPIDAATDAGAPTASDASAANLDADAGSDAGADLDASADAAAEAATDAGVDPDAGVDDAATAPPDLDAAAGVDDAATAPPDLDAAAGVDAAP